MMNSCKKTKTPPRQQELIPIDTSIDQRPHFLFRGLRVTISPNIANQVKGEIFVIQALKAFAQTQNWLSLLSSQEGNVQILDDGRAYVVTCCYSSITGIVAEYSDEEELLYIYLPVQSHWKTIGLMKWLEALAEK